MCKEITVCGQLESNFNFTANGPSVQFSDMSQNSEGRTWDFGDGITDTLKNPTHIYDLPGEYNACIHSFNDCESDSFCQMISIISTSTSLLITDDHFIIVPNPATNSFRIEGNEMNSGELRISDLSGKLLIQSHTYRGEEVSLMDFSAGSYIVEILVNGRWHSALLVKE
jgi:PKD repeat protein